MWIAELKAQYYLPETFATANGVGGFLPAQNLATSEAYPRRATVEKFYVNRNGLTLTAIG